MADSTQAYLEVEKSGGVNEVWRWNMLRSWEIPVSRFSLFQLPEWKHWVWAKKSVNFTVYSSTINTSNSTAWCSTFKYSLAELRRHSFSYLFQCSAMLYFDGAIFWGWDSQKNPKTQNTKKTQFFLASPNLAFWASPFFGGKINSCPHL